MYFGPIQLFYSSENGLMRVSERKREREREGGGVVSVPTVL